MTRIVCRTPSTGKSIRISYNNIPADFVTVVEAPDFSISDTTNKFTERDPTDSTRAIRPGEIFFLTPMSAINKDTITRWVETRLISEDGITVEFGKIEVPPGDTVFIPTQGRSLLKRLPNATYGDRLQIRAETAGIFDIWAAAEEKLSSEHIGVE